jgi:hypothetical protein
MDTPNVIQALGQFLGQCLHGEDYSRGLYIGLFSAGLVGSISHCAAMCGPFVIARSGHLKKLNHASNVAYHCGRMTTYVILAALFYSVLNLAFLFLPIRSFIIAPILASAGLIFLAIAFPKIGSFFPWVSRIQVTPPYKAVSNLLTKISANNGLTSQFFLGMILGLMPCGLVVSAIMAATTAPSIYEAALSMSLFALGTIPALLALQYGGIKLQKTFPRAIAVFTQIMLVWSSLWLFTIAGYMLI